MTIPAATVNYHIDTTQATSIARMSIQESIAVPAGTRHTGQSLYVRNAIDGLLTSLLSGGISYGVTWEVVITTKPSDWRGL